MAPSRRLAVIGLGLIGGSLGMALRREGWEVAGYSRSPETRALALERGAIDHDAPSLEAAVSGAQIVMMATPILAMEAVLAGLGRILPGGTIVTDAASTKSTVMAWARAFLPPGVPFIGGHPMAGKETTGIEAAQDDLFWGCTYCLVPPSLPLAQEEDKAMAGLISLVRSLRARPLVLEASRHDNLVAGISHLPLVAATALVSATARSALWPEMSPLAASGYRDTTRLASGSTEMSSDICLTNRQALVSWLDSYIAEIGRYRDLVEAGGEQLEAAFVQARASREAWLAQKRSAV